MNPAEQQATVVAHAERLCVAAILASATAWVEAGHLTAQDFGDPALASIYGAASACVADGEDPGVIEVGTRLAAAGKLSEVGGYEALMQLAAEGEGRDTRNFSWRVDHGSKLRRAERTLVDLLEHVRGMSLEDAPKAMAVISERLLGQQAFVPGDRLQRLSDVMDAVVDAMRATASSPGSALGVTTGFRNLDERWGTLQKRCFYVLGARPGMGKTALAANIAMAAAASGPGMVAYFSCEVENFKLGIRTLSATSGVGQKVIHRGGATDAEIDEVLRARDEARTWSTRFWLDDTPSQTPIFIRRQVRRLVGESDLRLVIADHMHLMEPSRPRGSDERDQADISRGLLHVAKEFGVPVLALAQLNRGLLDRTTKRPTPRDLRGSGAIEQDADVVAFLYRDEEHNEQTQEKGIAEVITAKCREGVPGTDKLRWDGRTQRFSEILVPKDAPEPAPKQRAKGGDWAGSWHEPPDRPEWDR